jgi:hypothetical protein
MKITLPLPPNMANGRFHWRVKHNKRKAYFEACGMMYATKEWPITGGYICRPDKARVRATIYCGGRMDVDNVFARMKWPIDWLVGAGILRGDSEKHLVWEMPVQIVKRNQQYRVEFELEAA